MYILKYIISGKEEEEVILKVNEIEDLTVCIYTFWRALKFEIPYFQFLNVERGCMKIDFGQHTRFYKVEYPKDESWNILAGKMWDKLKSLKLMNDSEYAEAVNNRYTI